jgi:beta-lactamase regulating signal transducer with metallopeptidase domain/thiol-disulfide isomerase/thioredoxin
VNLFVTWFAISSLWQLPLLLLIAVALRPLIRAMSKPSQFRFWACLVLLATFLPVISAARDAHFSFPSVSNGVAHGLSAGLGRISESGAITLPLRTALAAARWNHFNQYLLVLYLFACVPGMVRFGFSLHRTASVMATTRPRELDSEIFRSISSYSRALGIAVPNVLISPAIRCPAVVNWPSASLLLPTDIEEFAHDEISAALTHELAHVRRHDFLLNLIFEIVALPLFYHPALHWLRKHLNASRESACDEIAQQLMDNRFGYAHSLLKLANRSLVLSRDAALHLSVVGSDSELELRFATLLMSPGSRKSQHLASALCAAVVTCLATGVAIVHVRSHSVETSQELMLSGLHASTVEQLIPIRQKHSAAAFSLSDLHGNVVRLSDYRGQVVLLNFWATWCVSCRTESSSLLEIEKKYRSDRFAVVGIAMDANGRATVEPFVRSHGISYEVLFGNDAVANRFSLSAVPASFLIDRNGKVALKRSGPIDEAAVDSEIQTLIDGS